VYYIVCVDFLTGNGSRTPTSRHVTLLKIGTALAHALRNVCADFGLSVSTFLCFRVTSPYGTDEQIDGQTDGQTDGQDA